MNQRMAGSKPAALPLGDAPVSVALTAHRSLVILLIASGIERMATVVASLVLARFNNARKFTNIYCIWEALTEKNLVKTAAYYQKEANSRSCTPYCTHSASPAGECKEQGHRLIRPSMAPLPCFSGAPLRQPPTAAERMPPEPQQTPDQTQPGQCSQRGS